MIVSQYTQFEKSPTQENVHDSTHIQECYRGRSQSMHSELVNKSRNRINISTIFQCTIHHINLNYALVWDYFIPKKTFDCLITIFKFLNIFDPEIL